MNRGYRHFTKYILKFMLQVYSLVYQFEGHRLRRIQLMSTENPRYSLTYEFQKMNYVIIVQECSSKLYVWNGKCDKKMYSP